MVLQDATPPRGGVISAFARHRNFGKDQNMGSKIVGLGVGLMFIGLFGATQLGGVGILVLIIGFVVSASDKRNNK